MKEEESHIDNLIAKYLAGEALPEEAIALEAWCAESADNERYFSDAFALYHGTERREPSFDAQKAWQKVQATLDSATEIKVETSEVEDPKVISIHRQRPQLWKIAAGIALLVGLAAAIAYLIPSGAVSNEFASGPAISTETLFTGSVVSLNTHSNLSYRHDKKKRSEAITLSGEAHFDLNAPKGVTTEVEAGGLTVRDIGTSFHVSAYPHRDTVLVWVEEGEVAMYTALNPGITLAAGEGGIFIKSSGIIQAHTPTLVPNWQQPQKEFHFNKASLREIAKALNAEFEMKLEVPVHLQDCRITVSFVDETPLDMATIIAETLGLTLERKNDTLTLSGNGCPQ